MAGVTYLLDTNAVSDLLKRHTIVHTRLQASFRSSDIVCVCQPVYYEVLRGLLRGGATTKLAMSRRDFLPFFRWTPLTDDDWMQAAHYWASTVSAGKQLADVDLLIAAVAARLGAVIVSSDADFDALPVKREDWRQPVTS